MERLGLLLMTIVIAAMPTASQGLYYSPTSTEFPYVWRLPSSNRVAPAVVSYEDATKIVEGLFPVMDVNPKDNVLSLEELEKWVDKQDNNAAIREWQRKDRNHDGFVSKEEYYMEHGGPGVIEQLAGFNCYLCHYGISEYLIAADADGDGVLDFGEFMDMLHPQDTNNTKLHQWILERQDRDEDGKLSVKEFKLASKYYNSFEWQDGKQDGEFDKPCTKEFSQESKKKFSALDKDSDGFLTASDGLKQIVSAYQMRHNPYITKFNSRVLILDADQDKDGSLTLKEILAHPSLTRRIAMVGLL